MASTKVIKARKRDKILDIDACVAELTFHCQNMQSHILLFILQIVILMLGAASSSWMNPRASVNKV